MYSENPKKMLLVVGKRPAIVRRNGEKIGEVAPKTVVLVTEVTEKAWHLRAPLRGWVARERDDGLLEDDKWFAQTSKQQLQFPTRGTTRQLHDPVRDAREMGYDA